jgi:hypothetical protein
MCCGCYPNSTSAVHQDALEAPRSAVTAPVQVTFVNNVKKSREALAGLMDVSNLERCVVVARTEVVHAARHQSIYSLLDSKQ